MNKFARTYCSQCGAEFGPGDAGFSSCAEHRTASCTCPHELGEDRMLTIDGMLIEVSMDGETATIVLTLSSSAKAQTARRRRSSKLAA